MKAIKSWPVSEELWKRVEPLIPKHKRLKAKKYLRRAGGGRKSMDPRKVFGGIIYVLRTGCQWKALPKEVYGSPGSIHAYFRQWEKAGAFQAMWRAGVAE